MKTVAVFLSDDMATRRLTLAFRTRCAVQTFDDLEAVRSIAVAGRVLAMVVDMRQRPGTRLQDPVELIAELHATWPSIPVIGYVDFTPERARDILNAAHAGVAEIILGEFDELDTMAQRIADIGTANSVSARVEEVTQAFVPPQLQEFFRCCVTNATHARSVDGVIARLQRSRRTLSNWLDAAYLPPPSRIVGWMRLLVAARMLEDSTQSAEKIARELHFMSGTSLRNMLRRYLNCGPETLRQRGGFEYALSLFVDLLRQSQRDASQELL